MTTATEAPTHPETINELLEPRSHPDFPPTYSDGGLKVERRNTTVDESVYDQFDYERIDVVIGDTRTGAVSFENLGYEAPAAMNATSRKIAASKYARKTLVPQYDLDTGQLIRDDAGDPVLGPEGTFKLTVARIANHFMYVLQADGYFASEDDAVAWRDEYAWLLLNQSAANNSPVWFNTGVKSAYGIIEDSDGNFFYDPATGQTVETPDKYHRTNASACYINRVKDDLTSSGGILDLVTREGRLFKGGSGSGANLSSIRAKGEGLTGGGTASGVLSFMEPLDISAGAIKSGGTTRRAAKMVVLNIDHPEVRDYIWAKALEERKVPYLLEVKDADGNPMYPLDWESDNGVYRQLKFQNANHSVRVMPGFMQAKDANADWDLTAVNDVDENGNPVVMETVPARELWRDIAQAAWESADPGLQWHDLVNDWNTVADTEEIVATNPCFTGDTLVHTDKGLIAFGELIERVGNGETFDVYTHDLTSEDEQVDRVAVTSPEAWMVAGVNDIVRLEFSNGMVVRCTPNHRFWTDNGWVRADELTSDDNVQTMNQMSGSAMASYDMPVATSLSEYVQKSHNGGSGNTNLKVRLPEKWTGEFAHMMGWAVGDGSVAASNEVVSLTYGNDIEREAFVSRHGEVISGITGRDAAVVEMGNGTAQLRQTHSSVTRFLSALGLTDANGPDKTVPWSVMQAPQDIQAAFLRGLADADGTVVVDDGPKANRYVGYDSSSKEFLVGVQRLLTTFGISARLYQTCKPGQSSGFAGSSAGMWSLRITGTAVADFAHHIGFDHPEKAAKLSDWLDSKTLYRTKTTTNLVSREDDGRETTYNLCEPRNHSYAVNGLIVSNCSEYNFVDDTACNLASMNLVKFLDQDTLTFDVDAFTHGARIMAIALEAAIVCGCFPDPEIARRTHIYRTVGAGWCNGGAMLMRSGIPYDSDEGRAVLGAVTALLHATTYATSSEIAAAVGPCEGFDPNRDSALRVLRNHARAAYGSRDHDLGDYEQLSVAPQHIDHDILRSTVFGNLSDAAADAATVMVEQAEEHGLRNMQATVLAPTGTIGLLMGADTTGIEPVYSQIAFKTLAGGGTMLLVNQSVQHGLAALGYDQSTIDATVEHVVGKRTLFGVGTPINAATLAAKGLPEAVIAKVEKSLVSAMTLSMAFGTHLLGDHPELKDEFGVGETDRTFLPHLGFSDEDVRTSDFAICGHHAVGGAPGIADEHLAVFDAASPGRGSDRAIGWRGHVGILGATAPFLSGSASKTVNLPNWATVEDIEAVHDEAYALGVKCVAVYRDGSKQSQPLSSREKKEAGIETDDPADLVAAFSAALGEANAELVAVLREQGWAPADEVGQVGEIINLDAELAKMLNERSESAAVKELLASFGEVPDGMSPTQFYGSSNPQKFRLPAVRSGITEKFTIGNQDVFLTHSSYPDGSCGEIFLKLSKEGGTLEGLCSSFATAVSMGLQRGVPLEEYVDKFRGHRFEPAGVVQHPNLKMANSIIDAVFRILGHRYLGMNTVQVKTEVLTGQQPLQPALPVDDGPAVVNGNGSVSASQPAAAEPEPQLAAVAVATADDTAQGQQEFDLFNACPSCGEYALEPSGSCQTCHACGNTVGGCS